MKKVPKFNIPEVRTAAQNLIDVGFEYVDMGRRGHPLFKHPEYGKYSIALTPAAPGKWLMQFRRNLAARMGISRIELEQRLGAVYRYLDAQRRRKGRDIPLGRLGGHAEERNARRRKMVRLRREGFSNADIAERTGFSSAASVSSAFSYMRATGWDVPPGRAVTAAPPKTILALYEEGLPLAEIARRLGYKNAGSVSNRLARLKRQGYNVKQRRKRAVAA